MFYVTNTKVDIVLLGTNRFNYGSGVFLKLKAMINGEQVVKMEEKFHCMHLKKQLKEI